MKCPLFIMKGYYRAKLFDDKTADCIKEECAWWDDFNKRCDFKSIRVALVHLVATLEVIRERMPHELQFRK